MVNRRNFLKNAGIFTCGYCLGNISTNFHNFNILNKNQDNIFFRVSFMITHHCNLNCAGCDHFSPLAPIYFMPLDIFERDIIQLYKLTKENPPQITLMGGEPLLNKNISEYIKIARKYFKTKILVYTNGLLLNDMPDEFWKSCSDYDAEIYYTHYILHKNFPNLSYAHNQAKKYNVKLTSSPPRYDFYKIELNNKKINNNKEVYKTCSEKGSCCVIDNGILYPCQILAGVKLFFNKFFINNAFLITKKDFIDIHAIKTQDDISNFFKKPKNFCKYCNYGTNNIEKLKWRYSKKEIYEWLKA